MKKWKTETWNSRLENDGELVTTKIVEETLQMIEGRKCDHIGKEDTGQGGMAKTR